MRFLAIDPGGKRTGLAVGDDVTGVASPAGVVTHHHDQQRLDQIEGAIKQHEPDALVVGLPLNMDGTEGPAAAGVRALAQGLTRRFGLRVHLMDERLSSYEADLQMGQSGLTRKQKKSRRDALAAAVVLRSFFESR